MSTVAFQSIAPTRVHDQKENPESWQLPDVRPSQKTSQSIKTLVEERQQDKLLYQPFTLDSGETPDPRLTESRLSQSDLSGVDKSKPVILLAHGYSASSYEWDDLARYIDQNARGSILYSNIVLGGHGRSLETFKKSTWRDWGKPIVDEYKALAGRGFTNISLAGSSTACALFLEQLSSGSYGQVAPKNLFLIDPIVKPSDSRTSWLIWLASFTKYSFGPTQAFTPEEFSRWYGNRPFTTLNSLEELTRVVHKALTAGIQLPAGTRVSVWASQKDPTVDPEGYKLIEKGVKPGEGGAVRVYPVDSKFHVFTRLSGRPQATEADHSVTGGFNRDEVINYVKTAPIPFSLSDRHIQKKTFDLMLQSCYGTGKS